ncbi:MAG TPA: response regulator [Candidatus Nitrosotenuis sp.]|nr:response regulator [Candidatus Nitrosotenuis sp.]
MARVLALVDDLFFQAKILETARHAGVQVQVVGSGDALEQALRDGSAPPAMILLDLNARVGGLEALEKLRASGSPAPVIAFLSHVQTELAARARAAGCAEVMPRSQFTRHLAEILQRAKQPS